MTRRSEASGATLHEALTEAVAGVLDCEPEKVELNMSAPGSDALTGQVRVALEVADEVPPPAEDGDEAATPLPTEVADDRDADEEPADRADGADGADGAEDEATTDDEAEDDVELTAQDLDEEADAAADFLEGLLDAMDLPGDLRLRVHDDHAEIEVVDIGSGALIGRRGQTLEAIQELLRCALQREFQRRARVKVDAEGYRARRLEKLLEKAEDAIDDVLDTGEPQRLEPMDVFERKAVHQLVAGVDGLASRSQGREPARRVVIERE